MLLIRLPNRALHRLKLACYLIIPEPQNTITAAFEKHIPLRVFRDRFRVLPAVQLDNEIPLSTDEINDALSNRMLTTESCFFEKVASEPRPQSTLAIGLIAAEPPGESRLPMRL
jgi:hypothetical protein